MDKKSRMLVMGKLYFKNKDYKLAESSFLEYLNSSPEDFQALKLLAQTYEFQRDFSKAFDAYERCYLAEPDRKGVLLDMCRLLLLNDSSLDHIDSKKWLKLATQSFPSNPIVDSLKRSLPVADQPPSKTSIESEILDKLISMEKRLEQIETKIANLSLGNSQPIIQQQVLTPQKPLALTQPLSQLSQQLQQPQQSLKSSQPSQQILQPLQQQPFTPQINFRSPVDTSSHQIKPVEPPTPRPSSTKSTSVPVDIAKPEIPKPDPVDLSRPEAPKPVPIIEPPKPLFQNLTAFSKVVPTTEDSASGPTQKTEASLFSFGNASTGNIFANSLMKLNIESNMPAKGNSFGLGHATPLFSRLAGPENTNKTGDGSDDDGPVKAEELPIENTCDMKPIEIRSGEEDEDVMFKERCKLFRFRDKEYKERGLGDIKVLKHKETGKGRLIMRRELINLVCLNCWSCKNVERVRETQVRFAGLDASDGEPEMTVFLAKFKNAEMTDRFESQLKLLLDD